MEDWEYYTDTQYNVKESFVKSLTIECGYNDAKTCFFVYVTHRTDMSLVNLT